MPQDHIKNLLKRQVGKPPQKPNVRYHAFQYQAGSWDHPRRVVAKVEWHQGELFPRVGFIVTNLSAKPKGVVRFYNGRGTAEGKYRLFSVGKLFLDCKQVFWGDGVELPGFYGLSDSSDKG